jgi:hypothetical protein
MAQHREAPAFQEYAASMMARTPYRVMSLAGRGLLYSLRLECWVNRAVPSNPRTLARMLGYDVTAIEEALPEVAPFFAADGDSLTCPELEDYRRHLEGIREKQSQGGKQTAAKHSEKRKQADAPAGDLQVTCSSLVKSSSVKSSPVKQSPDVLMVDEVTDSWVDEYDQASNGY